VIEIYAALAQAGFNPLLPSGRRRQAWYRDYDGEMFQSTPSKRKETSDTGVTANTDGVSIHSFQAEGDQIKS